MWIQRNWDLYLYPSSRNAQSRKERKKERREREKERERKEGEKGRKERRKGERKEREKGLEGEGKNQQAKAFAHVIQVSILIEDLPLEMCVCSRFAELARVCASAEEQSITPRRVPRLAHTNQQRASLWGRHTESSQLGPEADFSSGTKKTLVFWAEFITSTPTRHLYKALRQDFLGP